MLQLTVLSFVTVNDTVKSQSQKLIFFHHPRVSPGDHPLTKKPADGWIRDWFTDHLAGKYIKRSKGGGVMRKVK